MKAIDIMSRDLVILNENTSIRKVAQTMKEKDIGFVPLCNDNKITGVITDRDIVCNAVSNNDINNEVKEYMTRNVIKVNKNDNISKILSTMRKNKIKRVLVENDNKKLVGIVSFSDILNNNEFEIMNTMKEIWSIKRNTDEHRTEIDDFYL